MAAIQCAVLLIAKFYKQLNSTVLTAYLSLCSADLQWVSTQVQLPRNTSHRLQ